MGKITRIEKNCIDITETLQALDACEEAVQAKRIMLREVKKIAEEYLKKVNRNIGRLEYMHTVDLDMELENMDDPIMDLLTVGTSFVMLFSSDRGYGLYVMLNIDDDISADLELSHDLENGREWYDWNTGEWTAEVNGWIEEVLKTGGTEAVFLRYLMDSGLIIPSGDDEQDKALFEGMCNSSKELLTLYEETGGMLFFDYTEDGSVTLIPDDPNVFGFAIQYKDGCYRFLRYVDDADLSGGGEAAEIFSEDRLEDVKVLLNEYLDHYYPEETFICPLSHDAYVRSEEPSKGLPVIFTSDEKVLPLDAKKVLKGLKRRFRTASGKEETI